MNQAKVLGDLAAPPGNRLEPLSGNLKGRHSIRINDQWRIVFRWTDAGPEDVEIVDYHQGDRFGLMVRRGEETAEIGWKLYLFYIILGGAMEFEYDPDKSMANKAKHGIDFEEAQALWRDDRLLVAPARTDDEPRFLAVGKIGDRHWSAVWVERSGRIRIISVRRAREQEIEHYEGA